MKGLDDGAGYSDHVAEWAFDSNSPGRLRTYGNLANSYGSILSGLAHAGRVLIILPGSR